MGLIELKRLIERIIIILRVLIIMFDNTSRETLGSKSEQIRNQKQNTRANTSRRDEISILENEDEVISMFGRFRKLFELRCVSVWLTVYVSTSVGHVSVDGQ